MRHCSHWNLVSRLIGVLLLTAAFLPAADAPAPPNGSLLEPNDEQQKIEMEFLHSLEMSLNSGDGKLFEKSLDVAALLGQSTKGLGLDPRELASLTASFEESGGLGPILAGEIKANGGSYKLLRVHTANGQRRALFRLWFEGKGLNYHDWVLTQDAENKYRIADLFIFVAGEMQSTTYRHLFLPLLAQNDPEKLKTLSPPELALANHSNDLKTMLDLCVQEKFTEALRLFKTFPKELQENRFVLLNALRLSQKVSQEELLSIEKTYIRLYPDDPALDLLGLDVYWVGKEFGRALDCIDHLQKRVGDDAVLLTIRATCLVEMSKYEEASQCVRRAVEIEKSLDFACREQVVIALHQKDWDLVFSALTAYELNVGQPLGDISKMDLYKDFIATDQYKQWQALHAK